MKKKSVHFFLFFKGIALRARLAQAFDNNDTRRMFAISRKIDKLQRNLILEAGLPQLSPK